MNAKESIKEKLLFGLTGLLLGSIGTILATVYRDAIDPFLTSVLPKVGNKTLMLLCLLLLLVCGLLVAYIFFLILNREVPLHERYRFDPQTGISTDRKDSDNKVCSKCLLTGVVVPLRLLHNGDLRCINTACGEQYRPAK